jgi:hypothetical protein
MALDLFTVLKLVPWDDVIRNAPKVADAASRFWKNARGKSVPGETPGEEAPVRIEKPTLDGLQARLNQAQAAIAQLQEQMAASGELINALAAQNTQLVARIEANRKLVLWLGGAVAVLLVAVVALAFWR